jgi:hypothetical protein
VAVLITELYETKSARNRAADKTASEHETECLDALGEVMREYTMATRRRCRPWYAKIFDPVAYAWRFVTRKEPENPFIYQGPEPQALIEASRQRRERRRLLADSNS